VSTTLRGDHERREAEYPAFQTGRCGSAAGGAAGRGDLSCYAPQFSTTDAESKILSSFSWRIRPVSVGLPAAAARVSCQTAGRRHTSTARGFYVHLARRGGL